MGSVQRCSDRDAVVYVCMWQHRGGRVGNLAIAASDKRWTRRASAGSGGRCALARGGDRRKGWGPFSLNLKGGRRTCIGIGEDAQLEVTETPFKPYDGPRENVVGRWHRMQPIVRCRPETKGTES